MNQVRTAFAFASAVVLALAMAGSVLASPPTGYHGVFVGTVDYIGCTTTPPVVDASGTWNMTFRSSGDVALSVNIFTNGAHHVSFGGVVPQVTVLPGEDYAVAFETGAGLLRMSISGTALSYAFPEGYAFDNLVCDNVIYHGTASR